jgi:large subunit ribosomal protein L21
MMKYAIVAFGGRQYQVEEGEDLVVDRLDGKEGDTVKMDRVLMVRDGDEVMCGKPVVDGVIVKGKILGEMKGKKVRVSKYKAKTGYRRVIGFRANQTRINIVKIEKTEKRKVKKKKLQ